MNEDKVIEAYNAGERETGVLLEIISSGKINMGGGGRFAILLEILKKHNLPPLPVLHTDLKTRNRQRLFIREYQAGHRDLLYFADLNDLQYWCYRDFVEFIKRYNYPDIKICSKEEFQKSREVEMRKVRLCKWLFEKDEDREYTMDELDDIIYRKTNGTDEGRDKYNTDSWLESFLQRCPNFEGYNEKKLRDCFKRSRNLWDPEVKENNAQLQSFARRLPVFLKKHGITDFERWHEKDKEEDDIKLVLNQEDAIISESKEEECLIDPEDEQ